MKIRLPAKILTTLKSLPSTSAIKASASKIFLKIRYSPPVVSVVKKFVAGTLITKIGISAISVSMVGATGLGGYLAVKQIVGNAGSQYVITAPASGASLHGDFPIYTEFRAASNVSTFNVVITMDGRTILSKVGSAINNGQKRQYIFSGGVNGANSFPLHNLKPGNHTLTATARTGGLIGQGTVINSHSIPIKANPKNIIVTGEGETTIPTSSLPINAAPTRNALVPNSGLLNQLASSAKQTKSSLSGAVTDVVNKSANTLLPKVKAHTCDGCRHGDIDVFTKTRAGEPIAGIQVSVNHPALDGCHNGNAGVTNGAGEINFRGCAVSNIGGTDATYTVTVGATPVGLTIGSAHSRTMQVVWNQNRDINFVYDRSAAPPPAAPATNVVGHVLYSNQHLGPNQSLQSTNGRYTFVLQTDGNLVIYDRNRPLWQNQTNGSGATMFYLQSDGNLVQYRSDWVPVWSTGTHGAGGDRLVMQDDGNLVLYNSAWQPIWYTNTYGPPEAAPPPPAPAPAPAPSAPAANYNHTPGDGPLLAVTKLSATGAEVDVFGYKTVSNLPADHVNNATVTIDGVQRGVRSDFSAHPAHRGTNLDFGGVNIADGQPHTLVFKATNDNGSSNSVTIKISPQAAAPPPAPTAPAPSPPPAAPVNHVGSIKVAVYAHDQVGQPLNKATDNRLGNVYITPESIGSPRQCPRAGGATNNDRSSGTNFGLIHFNDCPVAEQTQDNHAKRYRVSMNIPAGFAVDDGFNSSVGATRNGNVVSRDINVRKNMETEVSFLVIGNNSNVQNPGNLAPSPTPPPAAGTPTPTQLCDSNKTTAGVTNPTNGTGTLVACTYDVTGGGKTLIGNVEVHTKSIGAPDTPAHQCDPRNRTTSTNADNGSKGRAAFAKCPVAQDGGPKTYQFSMVERAGYRESQTSPHKAGCANSKYHFTAERNKAKRIEIHLVQGAGSVTCDPVPAPNPSNIGGSEGSAPPAPSANKAGTIKVETWIDAQNGGTVKDKPLPGIAVEMVSSGRPQDKCTPQGGTTSGDPPAISFRNCPVALKENGNNYSKQWEIYSVIPAGYEISSSFASPASTEASMVNENGVLKLKRVINLKKDASGTYSMVIQEVGGPIACNPSSGGTSPDCLSGPAQPDSTGVCSEIKAQLPGLTINQSQRYTDYLCGAAGRYKVNAALQLAIMAQESMGGELESDPITKTPPTSRNCDPTCKGFGQFSKSTWDAHKRDGVKFQGRHDGGSDGKKSPWDNQAWADAVYTGAYYIAKHTNVSRADLKESDIRHVYCKYKRPGNTCRAGTSGYNTSGTEQVIRYWKQYRSTSSDPGNTNPGSSNPSSAAGGSFGSCPRLASAASLSVTGSRAEIEARLLKFATSACQNKLRLTQGNADRTRSDIQNSSKTHTNLLRKMIVLIEHGGYSIPVNVLNTGHGCPSQHCDGRAIDIGYYSNTEVGKSMYKYIYANRGSLYIDELIFAPPPSGTNCVDAGRVVGGGTSGCRSFFGGSYGLHDNHIHSSVRR